MRTRIRWTRWRILSLIFGALVLASAVVFSMVMFVPRELPAKNTAATAYLPFNMPDGPSNRKVFAHYVPNFPISIDNAVSTGDYYTTQYLTRTGENGRFAAYGGLLRDRPLPRAPIASADWRDVDLRTEVNQAKSIGIDGFAVDIILQRSSPEFASDAPMRMMNAAQAVGGFSVMVTADISGPLMALSAADLAAEMAPYLSAPAAYRLSDGRPVLGVFFAEGHPASWWAEMLGYLKNNHGLNVAFVPTFLDAAANLDAFAPISYGFSVWGGRNPNAVPTYAYAPYYPVNLVRRAHELGKIWMQPVAYQDARPREGIFDEAANGTTMRQSWQIATDEKAEWVQLITWNDYAETTQFAPSVKQGYRMLDMTAYWLARYKYGVDPTVIRDALFVSHRIQPAAATPAVAQQVLMTLRPGSVAARDTVEVVAFATAPAKVVLAIGSSQRSCQVPAGMSICTFPLAVGNISTGLWRSGKYVTVVRSPSPVVAKPQVQDLQYSIDGGLR